MNKVTTADRLKQIMEERNMKQVDIVNACKPYGDRFDVHVRKNDLSQYVNGKVEPGSDKLTILGLALNVSETWLMGYDVPPDRGPIRTQVSGLRSDEVLLLDHYNLLNDFGKKKARDAVADLAEIPRYCEPLRVAAHSDGKTQEEIQSTADLMQDESRWPESK